MNRFRSTLLVWTLALTAAMPVGAATFCVSTPEDLRVALLTAEGNGEEDMIRLTAGWFEDPDGVGMQSYDTTEPYSLLVDGGWVRIGGACVLRFDDATATILSGAGVHQVMSLKGGPGASGSIVIRNLTIRDGNANGTAGSVQANGGGLTIVGPAGFTGAVLIDRVIFRNNDARTFGGALVASTYGTLYVRNTVFLANRCGGSHCAASLTQSSSLPYYYAVFAQNTVVANGCLPEASNSCAGGVRMATGGDSAGLFANNIFVANEFADIVLSSPRIDVLYNNYDALGGIHPPDDLMGNVIGVYPDFIDLFGGNLRLAPDSPVRDAGMEMGVSGELDLDGLPRIIGPAPDMGAYEVPDLIFVDSFDL